MTTWKVVRMKNKRMNIAARPSQVDVASPNAELAAAAIRFVPSLPPHHLALMQEIGERTVIKTNVLLAYHCT